MNRDAHRYARQVNLVEVGEPGQARIAESVCTVAGGGLSALVEARYLAGAGFGRLIVTDEEVASAARETNPAVEVVLAPSSDAESEASALVERGAPRGVAGELDALSSAARDVALGAYRALAALRAVVLGTGISRG
jgi:hypothetical protein